MKKLSRWALAAILPSGILMAAPGAARAHRDAGFAATSDLSIESLQGQERIDISGAWTFAVETSGGSGNPAFTFKQDGEKLSGTYKGLFGTAELTGSVKGRDIRFSFKVDFQGQQAEITYEGKVEDKDNMEGTVKMSDLGEGTWTGKRQP